MWDFVRLFEALKFYDTFRYFTRFYETLRLQRYLLILCDTLWYLSSPMILCDTLWYFAILHFSHETSWYFSAYIRGRTLFCSFSHSDPPVTSLLAAWPHSLPTINALYYSVTSLFSVTHSSHCRSGLQVPHLSRFFLLLLQWVLCNVIMILLNVAFANYISLRNQSD